MLGQRLHRIGLCWAILVVFCGFCWPLLGKSWDHIGLVLGHFGLCWDILGHVGQELGPYWACLGPFWAMLGHFGPCWSHIGLILGHFGLFSDLCRPLFWTRAFQRRWLFVRASVCKKHQKYQEKIHQKYQEKIEFVDYVADGFCCYFLVVFVSFLGHAAVRLCLPDLGLMLGIVGYVGTFWATLSHFWGILWFLYVSVGFCWARIGTRAFQRRWLFVRASVCKKHQKYQEKIHQKYQEKIEFVDYVADGFCCYFLVVFVSFLGHAAVRLCLPDLGLMLGIVGYVGTFWATLSHFWGILWFLYVSVGFCWARIGTILGSSWAIWAHLGPFWAIFHIGLVLGHFGLWISVVDFSSVQAWEKIPLFLGHFEPLGSGMSASLTFRPCKACAKKDKNTICIPQWISTTKCYDLGPGKWTKTLVWNF